jgi:hypothetical protein
MSNHEFSIQSLVFDTTFFSKEDAYDLQNRISRLFSQRMSTTMQEVFDKTIPKDLLVKADTLTLELGNVSYENFENEVSSKLQTVLLDYFSRFSFADYKLHNSTPADLSVVPLSKSYFDLLENFLLTGAFPWWAATGGLAELEKNIAPLFDTDPNNLRQLVASAGRLEQVRRRLGYQFSESFIRRIVRLVEPAESEFIFNYKANINKVHQQQPIVKTDSESFHKELWVFILTFLLVEKGSLFSRKEFVRSTLKKIAARFNTTYHELIDLFSESIPRNASGANEATLVQLINTLSTEEAASPSIPIVEVKPSIIPVATINGAIIEREKVKEEVQLPPQLEWLHYYLKHGSLPVEVALADRYALAETLLGFLAAEPDQVNKILSLFSPAVIQQRLYALGGNQLLERLSAEQSITALKDLDIASFSSESPKQLISLTIQNKEDVLYHFLCTGYLPWWAGQKDISLEELLEEVYTHSVDKAIGLLQWAGTEPRYKERFIQQFLPTAFIKLIADLPGGTEAVAAFKAITSILKQDDKAKNAEIILTHLLWSNYILTNYQSFNESLYYIQTVKAIAGIYHIPPGKLQLSTIKLIEEKNITIVQQAIIESTGVIKEEQPHLPTSLPSENNVIEAVLLQIEATGFAQSATYVNAPGTNKIKLALSDSLKYFLKYRSFTKEAVSKAGVTNDALFKSILLLLHKIDDDAVTTLFAEYSNDSSIPGLIKRLFSIQEYHEKQILLSLNKQLSRTNSSAILIGENTSKEGSVLPPSSHQQSALEEAQPAIQDNNLLNELPLVQQLFISSDEASPEQKVAKAQSLFAYFLTWNTLPQPAVYTPGLPVDKIIKEIVFYLFSYDRTALQTLLQRDSNLPEANIRLGGMLKPETGGKEALLFQFIQPHYQDALLDYIWSSDVQKKEEPASKQMQGAPIHQLDIPAFLTESKLIVTGSTPEQKAIYLLDYFLTYNKLPDGLALPQSIQQIVNDLTAFIFKKSKALLKNLLHKDTHHVHARISLHEWLHNSESSPGKEMISLTNEVLEKDVLLFLKHSSGALSAEVTSSLQALWKHTTNEDTRKAFLHAVSQYETVAEQLVKAIPLSALYSVLKSTNRPAKQYLPVMTTTIKLVNAVLQTGYEQEDFTKHSKVFLLKILAGSISIKDPADCISSFFTYLDNRKPSYIPQLYTKLKVPLEEDNTSSTEDRIIKRELRKQVAYHLSFQSSSAIKDADKKKRSTTQQSQLGSGANGSAALLKSNDQSLPKEPIAESHKQKSFAIKTGAQLYLKNAGLVLLHPFIPTFFMLTGLVEKNKFMNEEAQQRAVLLLQYLVYGTTEHEEQTLVLNKIFCGLSLEEPLPSSIVLSEKEIKIAAELFTVIFQRWERMKNASADGFRQSFLQRAGRLMKGEKTWTMRVEQRGYDALLQTMPWTFGVVKLPWMVQPIETEWMQQR